MGNKGTMFKENHGQFLKNWKIDSAKWYIHGLMYI